jgi:aminopeptidase-like protein
VIITFTKYCSFLIAFYFASNQNELIKKELFSHVEYLSSNQLEGRAPQTKGDTLAQNYIINHFENCKLKPFYNDYRQQIEFSYFGLTKSSSNIIATTGTEHHNKVIISAHYDHLGYGESNSMEINKYSIHPGADDNASGVAVMLQLSQSLSDYSKELPFDIVFVAFGAHELGLYGSKKFVEVWKENNSSDSIILAINLDMVGRMDENTEQFYFRYKDSTDFSYNFLLDHLAKETNVNLHLKPYFGKLDHSNLAELKIPTGTFTTGSHDDYHRTSDSAENINQNGMYLIWRYIHNLIVTSLPNNINIFQHSVK